MYEAEVANGAAWKDATDPGWERRFDPSTFSIASGCNCIIGQTITPWPDYVYSDVSIIPQTGWFTMEVIAHAAFENPYIVDRDERERDCERKVYAWFLEHGFTIGYDNPSRAAWEELERTWLLLIKERFESGCFSDDDA